MMRTVPGAQRRSPFRRSSTGSSPVRMLLRQPRVHLADAFGNGPADIIRISGRAFHQNLEIVEVAFFRQVRHPDRNRGVTSRLGATGS